MFKTLIGENSTRISVMRGLGFSVSAICALIVAAIPSGSNLNPITFIIADSEYGLSSPDRHIKTTNRKNAERLLEQLQNPNFSIGDSEMNYLSAYWDGHAAPIAYGKSQKIDARSEQHSEINQIFSETIGNASLPQARLIQDSSSSNQSKPPKPHKMNEYNFDPELLSLQCRPDFDYCLSTCDRNNNGKLDEDLTAEMECVSYCTRQAVKCELQVCKDKRDALQRSITKWGFFILLGGIALTFLIPPVGPAVAVVGFLVMMFSISPLMTWILAFQCS